MSQIKVGHFEADGGLVYLPLGFIPHYFKLIAQGASSTNAIVYEWFKEMGLLGTVLDGWSFTDGVDAEIAAASGIASYDSGAVGPTITTWSAGLTVVARSATAHGTYIRPTRGNAMDMDAIFEVVTNTTTGTTEPTWPAAIGEQVSDNHASPVVFERVNVPLTKVGYQGVRLAASMTGLANGNEGWYVAIEADEEVDHGDVDGWTGGIEGA